MLCDKCHEREANVFIHELRADGKTRLLRYCQPCAEEMMRSQDGEGLRPGALCDKCHERPARIFIREIGPMGAQTRHYCESCWPVNLGGDGKVDFGGLMKNLMSLLEKVGLNPSMMEMQMPSKADEVRCPSCGLSLQELLKRRRIGCVKCVEFYGRELAKMCREERSVVFAGKDSAMPTDGPLAGATSGDGTSHAHGEGDAVAKGPEWNLKMLRLALQDAVRKEEYMQAAALRDRIRQLEQVADSGDGETEHHE